MDETVTNMGSRMLAEWLEANLPAMVESLVQAEIARIVGKRR